MNECPYPGLRPFTREESYIFFGREEQADQLLEKLADTRFISIVGLSGCGKSSLVRAGMIAALESGYLASAGAHWRIATMRPGDNPMRHLAEALLADSALGPERSQIQREEMQGDANALPFLLASLRRGPLSLVEVLGESPLPQRTNLLLLVDQFEELFRYHREGGRDETEAFVNLLLASAKQDEVPIYIVTTMRSEYIGDCAFFHGLPEVINNGQFLVPRLTREHQEMAIAGPAGIFGGTIEPCLVNRLLNEMGTDPDQLPLLQHCLMRMWLRAGTRAGVQNEVLQNEIRITLEDYEAIGGLENALSQHADEAFAELNEKQQKIAEHLFRCLSERGPDQRDTRRPVQINEVAAVAGVSVLEVIDVVKVFRRPDRCFITPPAGVPLEPDSVLDISHESLIRQWKQLNEWADQEAESTETYKRLETTACLWKQGRAGLWETPDLENALKWQEEERPTVEWADRYGSHFDIAMEFLDASAQAQEEQRLQKERERHRKLRRLRQQLVVALLGLIIAISLTVWAFWERSRTQEARIKAEETLTIAEKRRKEAEEARKLAKEAQKEAELHSSRFQEMVNATFGFLLETKQNKEFLAWTEKNISVEKLVPAVNLMIDLSEKLDEEEKTFWHTILPDMTEAQKLELLDILGSEAADKIRQEKEFRITRIVVQDMSGTTIEAVDDIYTIKVGEPVTIKVDIANPYNHKIEVQWTAYYGKVSPAFQKTTTYLAEKAGRDIVIVHVSDIETHEEIETPINMTIVE